MKIKVITIEVPLSPRAKRIGLLVGVGALMLLGGGVASAGPPWSAGQTLTADDLNAIDKRIAKLESLAFKQAIQSDGSIWLTTGRFSYNDAGTTYQSFKAAKHACEKTFGTTTAHMCTAHEVERGIQIGTLPSSGGWYTTGTNIVGTAGPYPDCIAWTSDGTGTFANGVAMTYGTAEGPQANGCSTPQNVLCCD